MQQRRSARAIIPKTVKHSSFYQNHDGLSPGAVSRIQSRFLAQLRYNASPKSGALDPLMLPISVVARLDLCGLDMYPSPCV
jgi:hypothetical protein